MDTTLHEKDVDIYAYGTGSKMGNPWFDSTVLTMDGGQAPALKLGLGLGLGLGLSFARIVVPRLDSKEGVKSRALIYIPYLTQNLN